VTKSQSLVTRMRKNVIVVISALMLVSAFASCLLLSTDDSEAAFIGGYWTDSENRSGWNVSLTIDNEADLAQFAFLVNSGASFQGYTITVSAEYLDLSAHYWVPIGTTNDNPIDTYDSPTDGTYRPFRGTFEGNGVEIRGLVMEADIISDCQGLFGYTVGADIKDITLKGCDINGHHFVGGIAGYSTGSITNCCVEFSEGSQIHGVENVGGIAGYSAGSVTDCYNECTIDGGEYNTGGIAGYSAGSITNCYNEGDVYGSDNVGGIEGYSEGKAEDCYNEGDVYGWRCVGGIAGLSENEIKNCYSKGSVEGSNEYVGGIAGYTDGDIENCYNTGDVQAGGMYNSGSYVGGIAGYTDGDIENCYNTGCIEGVEGEYAGGIAGYTDGILKGCYNTGRVSSGDKVGGIAGASGGTLNISLCYNVGSITSSGEKNAICIAEVYPNTTYWLFGTANTIGGLRIDNMTGPGNAAAYLTALFNDTGRWIFREADTRDGENWRYLPQLTVFAESDGTAKADTIQADSLKSVEVDDDYGKNNKSTRFRGLIIVAISSAAFSAVLFALIDRGKKR